MKDVELDTTSSALAPLHAAQKDLFDTVDNLRSVGVGKIIDLPQIVVVGDQSSGKSSVLQAISRIRFPTKGGLCTRFATELILRTEPRTRVEVSIQTAQGEKNLGSLKSKDEIPATIEKVMPQMGIDDRSVQFSSDTLRIQVYAPDVPNLTLVDLPGFYHSGNASQSAEGKEIVQNLAHKYMSQKSSIILAVVSARNATVNQLILEEIQKPDVDPGRVRTLGVITQPDRLERGSSDEKHYFDIISGNDTSLRFHHDWHVLRNRSEAESGCSDDERDDTETAFFSDGIWADIPDRNKGAAAFRNKLSTVLYQHVVSCLPRVLDDIQKSVADRETQLHRLGDARESHGEMRQYLSMIAKRMEVHAENALQGNYADSSFFVDEETPGIDPWILRVRKLRSMVRDLNSAFVAMMYTKGCKEQIKWEDGAPMDISSPTVQPHLKEVIAQWYHIKDPTTLTESALKARAKAKAAANKGCEFPGDVNSSVALALFEEQARPWNAIASAHVDLMVDVSRTFVEDLLSTVVDMDHTTRESILRECIDPFFASKTKALHAKVQELLPRRRHGFLLPLEHEFERQRAHRRMIRMANQIERVEKGHKNEVTMTQKNAILTRLDFAQEYIAQRKGRDESVEEGVIDSMAAYYEMHLRMFTENTVLLAIENQLISEIPDIFTGRKVVHMEGTELEALAAESPDVARRRKTLTEDLGRLRKGLELCRRWQRKKYTPRGPELLPAREERSAFSRTSSVAESQVSCAA